MVKAWLRPVRFSSCGEEDRKNIIICNYDERPGYAGVPNPLYTRDNAILMTGDASTSVGRLVQMARG